MFIVFLEFSSSSSSSSSISIPSLECAFYFIFNFAFIIVVFVLFDKKSCVSRSRCSDFSFFFLVILYPYVFHGNSPLQLFKCTSSSASSRFLLLWCPKTLEKHLFLRFSLQSKDHFSTIFNPSVNFHRDYLIWMKIMMFKAV